MTVQRLRDRAEQALRLTRRETDALTRGDVKGLVHELQVHQIELEMQTEELRASQQELMASQAHYQELFERAPVGYVTLNMRGVATQVNALACELLGVPCESVLGQPLERQFNSEVQLEYRRVLAGAQVGARDRLEVTLSTPSGDPVHLNVDLTRSADTGGGWLIALSDITQQRRSLEALARAERELDARVQERTAALAAQHARLQAELARRAELESEHQALQARLRDAERYDSLGVLAGGIAHEFNNLLVGVLGNAELLRLTPQLPAECAEPLSLIMRAGRQALSLTRQLLVFAGKGQLNMATVELPVVVAEALERLRTRVPPAVQLQVRLGSEIRPIRADRAEIGQLVTSLLKNAIESLDGAGVLSVEAEEAELDREALDAFQYAHDAAPGRFVVLRVRDTGGGMDEETRARIFDPFFSTKFPGRGLGLATVRGAVHAHHGAFNVHSAPGAGACFEIALPVASQRADSERAPKLAGADWRGAGRLLLVDDDNSVRPVFAKLLGLLGFEVTEARSGGEALRLFQHAAPPFTLVVLDWIMPGLTGRQTLEALRALAPELPVLVISGYNPEDIGAQDEHVICLQKPMTLVQLREAACELLEGSTGAETHDAE